MSVEGGVVTNLFFCCFGKRKKNDEDALNLPKIVITCHEDTGGEKNISVPDELDPHSDKVNHTERKSTFAETLSRRDELSRAHQEVIDQMRNAIKEARGGTGSNRQSFSEAPPKSNDTSSSTSQQYRTEKPPVPPTKAAAVAKIRATIAQSKIEQRKGRSPVPASDVTVCGSPGVLETEGGAAGTRIIPMGPDGAAVTTAGRTTSTAVRDIAGGAVSCPSGQASAEGAAGPTAAAIQDGAVGPRTATPAQGGAAGSRAPSSLTDGAADAPCSSTAPNPARAAAVGKLRAALLAAAMDKCQSEDFSKLSTRAKDSSGPTVNLIPAQNETCKSRDENVGVIKNAKVPPEKPRRKSSCDPIRTTEKQKPLIWEFFEDGKKKTSCRTCGYTFSKKTNTGGLVRHLSLVHQKEYRIYTNKMETNWTHGMMEKNLNMRLPKNF